MGFWQNNDGLGVKLGVTEAVSQDTTKSPVGEVHTKGDLREVVVLIPDLTKLATGSATILNDDFFLPKNARIDSVEVEVVTGATSGGAATLKVGTIKSDRSTVGSATAFVADPALATIDTAGKKLTLITGATAAGASIGTTLSAGPYLITAQAGTAVYTAGAVRIRIRWFAV
jgi:hypothetical protein